MYTIFKLEGASEYSIMVLFDSSFHAVLPLHDSLASCAFPVSFIYGDNDWTRLLDHNTAEDIVSNKGGKVHTLLNSDHNMHINNSEGLATCILKELLPGEEI